MKVFGSQPHLPTLICIIGYSFSVYIPVCLLCVVPDTTFHVIVAGWGVITSTGFMLANCWKDMSQYEIKTRKWFLLIIIVIFQTVMYLNLVLYFFGLTAEVKLINDTLDDLKKNINLNITNITGSIIP